MSKYKAIAADAIKYAVIIGMYLILQEIDPVKGLGANLQNRLVTALISVLASLVILDFVFGRPELKFAWLVGGRPILGGWPELQRRKDGRLQEVAVTATLSGSGVLYQSVLSVAKGGKVRSEIKFTPSRAVMATLSHGAPHHDFNVEQNTLVTSYLDGFTKEGTFPAAFTFTLPAVNDIDRKVGCQVSWKGSGFLRSVFLWLAIKRTVGISGFNVKGE